MKCVILFRDERIVGEMINIINGNATVRLDGGITLFPASWIVEFFPNEGSAESKVNKDGNQTH
jgi:hypothetical protein